MVVHAENKLSQALQVSMEPKCKPYSLWLRAGGRVPSLPELESASINPLKGNIRRLAAESGGCVSKIG